MAREDPQLKLRLSDALKDAITEAAKANGRSINAEIVARLEEHPRLAAMQDELTAAVGERQQMIRTLHVAEERFRQSEAATVELSYRLRETQNENVELKEQVKEQVKEIEQLRIDLAYQQGMSAALRHASQIYVRHLARAADGERISLEKIMAELNDDSAPMDEKE